MKRIITILLICLSLQMSAQCWQSISAGTNHTLAIKNDGTLWGWGLNTLGQLGDNLADTKLQPVQIGTATNWVKISAGNATSLALKSDGTLWACGWNTYGQIGTGVASPAIQILTQIGTATTWQNISAGIGGCLATRTNGTLWAWGYNNYGQIGDNTTINKLVPTQIGTATNWSSISSGFYHSAAIRTDGTLWTWGRNVSGELGNGTNTQSNVPIQIGTGTNWQKIHSGAFNTFAVKTDGTLWSWGSNSSGQLGDGTTTARNVPTQIGTATNWLNISAGANYTYATKADLSLWSWGKNDVGQLANGSTSTTNTLTPTQVGLSLDTNSVSAGDSHIMVKNVDGFLSASGLNADGQIGDATIINKSTLVNVSCTFLAVNDFGSQELKIYPNPIKDILNIKFETIISNVSIYNMLGQQVMSNNINANETSIDTSALTQGTYILNVTSNQNTKSLKIIKE